MIQGHFSRTHTSLAVRTLVALLTICVCSQVALAQSIKLTSVGGCGQTPPNLRVDIRESSIVISDAFLGQLGSFNLDQNGAFSGQVGLDVFNGNTKTRTITVQKARCLFSGNLPEAAPRLPTPSVERPPSRAPSPNAPSSALPPAPSAPQQQPQRPAQAPPIQAAPPPASPPPIAAVSLANLINRHSPMLGVKTASKVIEGDARDILFFFNETDSAPNGVRGLSGDITFSKGAIRVCLIGESKAPDEFMDWVKIDWVQQNFTIENFNLKLDRCQFVATKSSEQKAAPYDLFAVERRLLTNNVNVETQSLVDIAQMIHKQVLAYFSTSEWAPFEVYQEARRAEAEKNLKLLRAGKLEGYGLALLVPELDVACGSDAQDKEVLNEVALRGLQSFTEPNIRNKKRLTLLQGTAEAIFVQAKRRQCGFIVGDATYLKPIVSALERDGQKVTIAPLWLKPEKVDEIIKIVASKSKDVNLQTQRRELEQRERDAEATRKQEEARQKVDQEDKLASAKKANDDKEKQEDLKRMRKLVESRGQALVDIHNAGVRKHVGKSERMGDGWSPFPSWFLDRVKEEWQFGDTKATLEDYGLAKWRSRLIEAVVVKVEFPMVNRLIGERQTACWQFVWINDEEFNMMRNAIAVPCDKYVTAFKKWTDENLFKSQWKL